MTLGPKTKNFVFKIDQKLILDFASDILTMKE